MSSFTIADMAKDKKYIEKKIVCYILSTAFTEVNAF